MSWLSGFVGSFVSGLSGGAAVPTPSHPNQQPLVDALNQVNAAGATIGQTVTQAAETAVNGYLQTTIGPLGAELADVALDALIASASAKKSGTGQAAGA